MHKNLELANQDLVTAKKELEIIITELFQKDIQRILITNINSNRRNINHYCLILDKDKIELIQKNVISISMILLDLSSFNIFFNSKKQSVFFISPLLTKIKSIIRDLKHNKASVFEGSIAS